MVFKAPIRLPQRAIRRIARQPYPGFSIADARVPPFVSVQQEVLVYVPSNAALSTWLAGPPSHPFMHVTVQDSQHVLPYTTLAFTVIADDVGPMPSNDFEVNMGLDTGMTHVQARDALVQQINAWVAARLGSLPNLRSMNAVAYDTGTPANSALLIRMPWGMTGNASFTYAVPGAIGGNPTARTAGVDLPLAYGILGKRRHVFAVIDPLQGPYYGAVPPT